MKDLELKLKISASAVDAIKTFGDLKQSLGTLGQAVAAAQAKTTGLAREFKANQQRGDELRVEYALGQRELARLAETVGKTSPEYRALDAELKQMAAGLKAADHATAQSEKAFESARQEAGQLKDRLDAMRQATHRHREALRAQGVDVGNLAGEYTRLKREAESAQDAQARKSAIAQDREALGLGLHADTQAKIAAIHAAVERLRASGSLTFDEMAQAELKADQLAQDLAHDLNGVGDSLAALQGDLLEFGAALAAVYATADQAIQFESGFAGVAKVVDATTGELAALSDELLKMTRSLPNAASEMLDIAESAGSLGIAADEVGLFTEGVAKLSAAFKMQAGETADYVAGIKNGFGLSVDQALALGDAVNILGNRYAATENDILNVDARIAASAKTFGLSAEQASALGATLLSLKQPPEVAATAINGLLSRLQSARVQSPEFQKALQAIGIDANQLANNIAAHPQQALDKFLGTLAELDNASLAEATTQLIGSGGDAMALQQLVQNRRQYAEAVNTATDKTQTAGAVEREFAAQMATTDAQLKLAKNSVVELAVNVGNTLLPAVTGAANAFQTFVNALADAAKSNPELTKLLAIFTPLIAGASLLRGIGLRLAVMWGRLRAAFAAGGAASAAMSGGLGTVLAGVMRLIGGPIGLLILALTTLADWWGSNKDKEIAWGDEAVTVADIVRTAWGYVMRAAGELGDYLARQFGKMGADVDGYAQDVKDAGDFVIRVFAGLGNGIGEGLAVFVEDMHRYFGQAVKLAQAAGRDIQAAMRLDFSAANVSAQWAANGAENRAAEIRRNGAGFSHGFGVAFDEPGQSAAGQAVKSVVFKAGQAVSDWTTAWRGEFRAQMARDDKARADAEAEAKKQGRQDQGGGDGGANTGGTTGGGRSIDWEALKAASGGGPMADYQKAAQAVLETELSAIRLRQDALKSSHDLELKQLEATINEEKLKLEQQVVDQVITEQQKEERLLTLTKDTDAQKITLEARFIEESAALQKAAVVAQIQAENAKFNAHAQAAKPAANSLAAVVSGGESKGYNDYNKGTKNGTIIPADKPLNLTEMTLGEIQARQALAIGNSERLGAVGKYQNIKGTLQEAIEQLALTADTQYDAATQEKIFAYTVGKKRPAIQDYITGQSDDALAAQIALAMEYRSVADPRTGLTYADKGAKANAASVPPAQSEASLKNAKSEYQRLTAGGMGHSAAYTQAVSGLGGMTEEREAHVARIKALDDQLVAGDQDRVAKLKSLGIDAQNAETEQSSQALEIKKDEIARQKALTEERLKAERDAALDELATRERAAQVALDLGKITESENLDRLRQFADERLKIEQRLLDEKRKLYKDDELALLQNLNAKKQAERDAARERQEIADAEAKSKQDIFEGMMAPFKNAVQQMTNGVLTGQQTISNAVKNAANSMLVTYASTFIQQRVMQAAQWAWTLTGAATTSAQEKALKEGDVVWAAALWAGDKARMVADWTWEVLGFAKKEKAKTAITQQSWIWETLVSAKKKVVAAGDWAWETLGFGLKEAKKRAISAASWAWEALLSVKKKAVIAAEWLWEVLGFGAKETAKTTAKAAGEVAQTAAQLTGDSIRTASTVTAEGVKKSVTQASGISAIVSYAAEAAAGAYKSLVGIPIVGPILAPIAAGVAFAGVLAFKAIVGSAKGGEWEVGQDDAPFLLHKKESVLPAGVADNFRHVVEIVRQHTGGGRASAADDDGVVPGQDGRAGRFRVTPDLLAFASVDLPNLMATGRVPAGLSLPDHVANFGQPSAERADELAKAARTAERKALLQQVIAAQQAAMQPSAGAGRRRDELHIHTVSADELFSKNSRVIVKQLAKEVRRFNRGGL